MTSPRARTAPGRPPGRPRLTAAQARRIALAAQGFADARPAGRVDARHIRRVLDRIVILQIDSVNVLARAHYLPVFARIGDYPRDALDRMTGYVERPRNTELFEYWAHAASLVQLRHQPLLRWRMARAAEEHWQSVRLIARDNPGFLDEMRRLVADQGPIVGSDTGIPRPEPRPGHMWNWHIGKIALEHLFYAGEITTAKRVNFERHYDLTERVIPREILDQPTPDPVDAKRELVRLSARALGVATIADLRDYFRLRHDDTTSAVRELVDSGEMTQVTVDGWQDAGNRAGTAYLWHEARRPRAVHARALLAPFDPLIWFRERTERIFGMHYRIEIYTREQDRQYGYYVLPFLLGEDLVGRVDLKADRQAGVLRVQSAWLEPGRDPAVAAPELAAELATMAGWLGLGTVVVMPRGDFAAVLDAAISTS